MRNHYIPQFYTKRWTNGSGKLWVYTRPYKQVIRQEKMPVQVGYMDDLYTIPFIDDAVRYVLETVFFKKIDQEGNDALLKLLSQDKALSPVERLSWAVAVIALKQRHPEKLQSLSESYGREINKALEEARERYYEDRLPEDTRSFEQYLKDRKSDEWLEREKKIALRNAILIPKTLRWITSSEWAVICPPENSHDFLTSDWPVIMTNGLARVDGHIALPISPKHLWIAADRNTIAKVARLSKLVEQVNMKMVDQACKMVFASHDRHSRFIENQWRSKTPVMVS